MARPTGFGGINLGQPIAYSRGQVTPGPPGPQGPPGEKGDKGDKGDPALVDVIWRELPVDGDVRINATPTSIIAGAVPAGRYILTVTVAVANRSPDPHRITVWATLVPGFGTIAGPRSAQMDLPAGGAGSVSFGPVWLDLTGPSAATVAAMRDGDTLADVWATEGTELANRAGATGLLLMAVAPGATGS